MENILNKPTDNELKEKA
jgi:hypothetical protein